MKNTKRKKLSFFFLAFLVTAFVFFAVGLGTLGSVASTGKAYELVAPLADDDNDIYDPSATEKDDPCVIFSLSNPTRKDENGNTKIVYTQLVNVYINIAVLYSEEGEDVEIELDRGTSGNSFPTGSSYNYTAKIQNLVSTKADKPQTDDEESEQTDKEDAVIKNGVFNWIAPFEQQLTTSLSAPYRVGSYFNYRLKANTHNVLINEVVFVGEILRDSKGDYIATNSAEGVGMGEYVVLDVNINQATPNANETNEQAKARAGALIDAQRLPDTAQSTFSRFSTEEVYSMISIAEMRNGRQYAETSIYHGDAVYNTLGQSILAFGTTIFGMSPFGLRFFPMCAAFGILVVGYFFTKSLFKSEKAGFAFALIYALCNLSFGLGHLGTPLMLGAFFFLASVFACYQFYSRGMKDFGFKSSLPLTLSGLCAAAAICVNGVFVVPVLGVVGLFAAGLVRQMKARRHYLDIAIERAETEEAEIKKLRGGEAEKARETAVGKAEVAQVLTEYRNKNVVACCAFFTTLVLGALVFSLLFLIPWYYVAVKLFDNVASPSLNVFALAAKYFAGGFTGANSMAGLAAWNPLRTLFVGTGSTYAITALVMNVFAAIAGLLGIAFAIWRIIVAIKTRASKKRELRSSVVLLAGIVICLLTAIFAKGAVAFLFLAYVFAFISAGGCIRFFTEQEGRTGKVSKVISYVGVALLAACFLLFAVFTFSIPLPAGLIGIFA